MRKIGAVSLTAFYLLLTTGVYVCLLHCTAERFLGVSVVMTDHDDDHDYPDKYAALPLSHNHQHETAHHNEKKPCKGGNCDCCNKHGNYTIKENIGASTDFSLVAIPLLTTPLTHQFDNLSTGVQLTTDIWPYPNGPPLLYKPPHYIFNRSLLI
jgi:hypothetical protein